MDVEPLSDKVVLFSRSSHRCAWEQASCTTDPGCGCSCIRVSPASDRNRPTPGHSKLAQHAAAQAIPSRSAGWGGHELGPGSDGGSTEGTARAAPASGSGSRIAARPGIHARLQQIPKEELQLLSEKIFSGNGLNKDRNWNNLLQQAASPNRLSSQQIDKLKRWAARSDNRIPMQHSERAFLRAHPRRFLLALRNLKPGSLVPAGSRRRRPRNRHERRLSETTDWISEHVDVSSGDSWRTRRSPSPTRVDPWPTCCTPNKILIFGGGFMAEPAGL